MYVKISYHNCYHLVFKGPEVGLNYLNIYTALCEHAYTGNIENDKTELKPFEICDMRKL